MTNPKVDSKPSTINDAPSDESLQLAAQCWCDPETEDRAMDVKLAVAFAKRLDKLQQELAEAKRQLQFTNSNWPHEKKLHEELAAARAEIEWLKCELVDFNEITGQEYPIISRQEICDEVDRLAEQLNREREVTKVLTEAIQDGTYNCVRETLALMAEGEGSNPQTYMDMSKYALRRLDEALARAKELRG